MEYITAAQVADKWGVSIRQVQRFAAANRIPGGKKHGHEYLIPADATKPVDPRKSRDECGEPNQIVGNKPKEPLSDDVGSILSTVALPMPYGNPDAVTALLKDDRQRLHCEAFIAYLRGDFDETISCYRKIEGDEAARLVFSSVTTAAAISTGNYALWKEIEASLIHFSASENKSVSAFADLSLATAYTGAGAHEMVADWIKTGDFSALPVQMKSDAFHKRAKYLQWIGQFEAMLAVAQSALSVFDSDDGIVFHSIYYRISCAIACCYLGRFDETKRWLSDGMKIAFPHGFIAPFAEVLSLFGGLLEQCIKQEFPENYDAVVTLWKFSFNNWTNFYNLFARENIENILSLQYRQIARLAAQGVPYHEIAGRIGLTVGSVSNKMQVVYDTLFISGKKRKQQLKKFFWDT